MKTEYSHIIYYDNVYIEDIFDFVYNCVQRDCGDGHCVIRCKNYIEARNKFYEFLQTKHPNKIPYELEETKNWATISYYQEGWSFTDEDFVNPFDYTIIIKNDCRFGWSKDSFVLQAISND